MEKSMYLLELNPDQPLGVHHNPIRNGRFKDEPGSYGWSPICIFDNDDKLSYKLASVIATYSNKNVSVARKLAEVMESYELPIKLFRRAEHNGKD